jgi:hypothetical protein
VSAGSFRHQGEIKLWPDIIGRDTDGVGRTVSSLRFNYCAGCSSSDVIVTYSSLYSIDIWGLPGHSPLLHTSEGQSYCIILAEVMQMQSPALLTLMCHSSSHKAVAAMRVPGCELVAINSINGPWQN